MFSCSSSIVQFLRRKNIVNFSPPSCVGDEFMKNCDFSSELRGKTYFFLVSKSNGLNFLAIPREIAFDCALKFAVGRIN